MIDLSRYLYNSPPAVGERDGLNPLSLLASTVPPPLAAAPPRYSFGGPGPQQAMTTGQGGVGPAGPTEAGPLDYLQYANTLAKNVNSIGDLSSLFGTNAGPTGGMAGGGLDAFGGGTGLGAGIEASYAPAWAEIAGGGGPAYLGGEAPLGAEAATAGGFAAAAPLAGLGVILAGIAMAEMDQPEHAGGMLQFTNGALNDFGGPTASGTLAGRGPALLQNHDAFRDALAGYDTSRWNTPNTVGAQQFLDFGMSRTDEPNVIDLVYRAPERNSYIYAGTDPTQAAAALNAYFANPQGFDPTTFSPTLDPFQLSRINSQDWYAMQNEGR